MSQQENKNEQTVLVTGGAGFVGSHLVEGLLQKGYKVVSLDNYFTGSRHNHIEGAEYVEGDTRNIEELIDIKPHLVYHLGEYARVEQSFDDVETVWEFNAAGTFRVLEFCRKIGAKVIYAGSSTKFGDNGLGIHQSPYAWTKAINTELVRNYGDWFGLDYAITYFYNVYGPREISTGPYATLIGIFTNQYKEGRPLTVVSPGTQRRNFTYVADIVEGLILVGEHGHGDDYGIGDPRDFSILEVAEMFGASIEKLPERKGNRMGSSIDTSKVEGLGWRPVHKLEDYIQSIIDSTEQ